MHYLLQDRQNSVPIPARTMKRVLIIEDNPVHRRLMESELKGEYDLSFAADSQTALAYLDGDQAASIDLVVLDLFIPERVGEVANSEEAIKILRSLQKGPTVVIISGSPTEALRSQLDRLEIKRIFEKPFSLTEFREYIDLILGMGDAPSSRMTTRP